MLSEKLDKTMKTANNQAEGYAESLIQDRNEQIDKLQAQLKFERGKVFRVKKLTPEEAEEERLRNEARVAAGYDASILIVKDLSDDEDEVEPEVVAD